MRGIGQRPLRRPALVVAGLGVVLTLLVVVNRGPGELERWKTERQTEGEIFSTTALASPVAPAMNSAMQKFSGAVGRLQVLDIDPGDLELMRPISPGYARVLWKEATPLDAGARSRRRWEDLATQMNAHEAALCELRALLGEPLSGTAHELTNMTGAFSSLLFSKQKCLYWLAGAEVDALHRGALDEAAGNLHGVIALARMNHEEWTLVNQMFRVNAAGYGLAATWEALQAPGWDETRLAALQREWERVNIVDWFPRTIEVERARSILLFEYARTNRQGLSDRGLVIGLASTHSLARTFNSGVYLPVWQLSWSKADELFYLQSLQNVLSAVRQPRSGSFAAMRSALEAGRRDRKLRRTRFNVRHALSDALEVDWKLVLTQAINQERFRQIGITAIALQRYQVRHGGVPHRLAALVPEFLAAPPRDSMTGHDLLYERNADGSWALYSPGENGRAENALGDDIVWPQAGYPNRWISPAPGQTSTQQFFEEGPVSKIVGKLSGQLNLALQIDPKAAAALTNRLSIRLEQVTPFEALEEIIGSQGLLLTQGPIHRFPCVIADPYPLSFYYDDITDQPSSGEVQPLIVIDAVPLTEAIRNLARHARINFQFDPKVTARTHSNVTLRYENESAEAVLKKLAREQGLALLRSKKSGIVLVTTPQDP